MPDPDNSKPAPAESMIREVELRASRMIRGRRAYRGYWRAVALVGVIGWTVVLPMLAGVALGTWIDQTWPSQYSWTLMLLTGGLGLGCWTAWLRIKEEGRNH